MSSYSGHIRLLVILVLFLALLTIASIILSVVSITSWGKKDNGPADYDHYKNYYYSHYGKDKDDKMPYHPPYPYPNYPGSPVSITNSISSNGKDDSKLKKDCYTIAFSDDWHHHEYIDDHGALRGWGPSIALAACDAAGLKCKIVYTPYDHCIDYFSPGEYAKHPIAGAGLAHEGVDACGGWFPEQERFNVAGFTEGWIRNPYVYLWYYGSSPSSNVGDIGFNYASPWNEKCLRRYLARENIIYDDLVPYDGAGATYNALKAGTVQLAFISDLSAGSGENQWDDIDRYSDTPMRCAEGDAGLVTRKCNFEFIEKFNKGLSAIKHNGVMEHICDDIWGTGPDKAGAWCTKEGVVYA